MLMNKDKACKTPRWMMLKAQLNNLEPKAFKEGFEQMSNSIIVDVRTEKEFAKGHIQGAIHINYFADDYWDKIEALDASQNIFVYCRSGRRSIRTCTLMRNGGFSNDKVFNLEGGWNEWVKVIGIKDK